MKKWTAQIIVNTAYNYLTRNFKDKLFYIEFSKMLRNPAGERNKEPILEVLRNYIDADKQYKLLEISSGCGLHASFIGKHFPKLIFQPSEYDVELFKSITEYTKKLQNIYQPIFIDISQEITVSESQYEGKPLKDCKNSFDFMLNINMLHISPYECAIGLFKNSSYLLKTGGILFTYGPYSVNNVLTPESNVSFNVSLKSRNSAWGIRDVNDLNLLAKNNLMELSKMYDLPANNKLLVWKRN